MVRPDSRDSSAPLVANSILKGFTLWQNGKNKGDYGSAGVLSELNC